MYNDTFKTIILLGRPASGKSEITSFLLNLPEKIRREKFHIAQLKVLDDFPMLWTWFEEDAILSEKFGLPRLYTDNQGYFKYHELWHLLIERLCLDYGKLLRDDPSFHEANSCLIEFSRGSEHGGYADAFQYLSDKVLEHAVIMYVSVTFEESLRKNQRRFNPDRPDSILEHGLSDQKLELLYRDDDFTSLAPGDIGKIEIREHHVPFVIFPNEDDVTTGKPDQLTERLETVLGKLWETSQSEN